MFTPSRGAQCQIPSTSHQTSATSQRIVHVVPASPVPRDESGNDLDVFHQGGCDIDHQVLGHLQFRTGHGKSWMKMEEEQGIDSNQRANISAESSCMRVTYRNRRGIKPVIRPSATHFSGDKITPIFQTYSFTQHCCSTTKKATRSAVRARPIRRTGHKPLPELVSLSAFDGFPSATHYVLANCTRRSVRILPSRLL